MDNEAIVDQIVRSLSFEVVAVPQDIIHLNSTSKSTPLNVKIRVRKKADTGLRYGVLSTPKIDLKDNVPDRIRLVNSDRTIMSFNVLMEADFDNVSPKHQQSLNMELRGLAQKEENRSSLSKHADRYRTLISAKRNKDVFGTCKPGGCLDPPFGEEKYSYQPLQQNFPRSAKKDETNKLRTSSIFQNKLFRRKKKHSQDELKSDKKESPKPDSILSIYEAGSLQSSTNYSTSIMTYPHSHPSNSSLLRLEEQKVYNKQHSSHDKSNISVSEGNGSYFILPKKTKKLAKQNDIEKLSRNDTAGENDFHIIKKVYESVEPNQKDLLQAPKRSEQESTRLRLPPGLRDKATDDKMKVNSYKSSELKLDELKYDTKLSNFIPNPLTIAMPVELNDNIKENIVENVKTKDGTDLPLSNYNISSILDIKIERKVVLKDDNNKGSIAEMNKTKDSTESPLPNDDISLIQNNQIKQKILLRDNNNKESTIEINKTKDGTKSPIQNDDVILTVDNQIKEQILLKDDNNKKSLVDIKKTKNSTELLNPNDDISLILDSQIKQKILLENDYNKESIIENNKSKDGTESPIPNDDISLIQDNQIKHKILLKDDNNKESIIEIKKTKDGTKSPIPNDDVSLIIDNQIKQKILLKDDNNKQSMVDINKTENSTELPMPNDDISLILDNPIKQKILLEDDYNKESIIEINKSKDDTESPIPNDDISLIQDNQIKQKILLEDDNNKESIKEINNTKDGTKSPMPNDDVSIMIYNQIKQKILLKDDNNKESMVDLNKTKNSTESPMPNDDISLILDNQIKQKIPLEDDNKKESIIEINKIKDDTELPIPNDDISLLQDNQIKQKILLEDDNNKESIKEINNTKDGTKSPMPNDNVSLILNNKIKQKLSLEGNNSKEPVIEINETKDDTSLPNDNINPILDNQIKRKLPLNDKESVVKNIKPEGSSELLSSNYFADHLTMKNISVLNSVNVPHKTHNSEDNSALSDIKTLNYIDDVNENTVNTTDKIHPQDEQTNIYLEKSDNIEDDNTFLINQMVTSVTSPYTDNNSSNYNNSNKMIYSESSESKSPLLVPTIDRPVLDLMAEPSQQVKYTQNVDYISMYSVENSKTSKTFSSEDLKYFWENMNEPLESAANVVSTLPIENSFDKDVLEIEEHLTYIPEEEQFSAGISNNLHLTSTTNSLPQTVTDEISQVNIGLSAKLSKIDIQTDKVMSDDYIMKFKTEEEPRKAVQLSFSRENSLTTKELSSYKTSVIIGSSTQSIIDTKSVVYKATVTGALTTQNEANTKNILNGGIAETREVDYMDDLTPYKYAKSATAAEQVLSKNLSEVSFKIPQPTTILQKSSSWKMDIALRSYNNENNERVIKSFDSDNIKLRQNDALLVAQCLLRSGSNEIKIPIDQENDLCVTIKSNKSRNIGTTNVIDTNKKSVLSDAQHKKRKVSRILPDSVENNEDYEYVNKPETKTNKTISGDIREVLTKIYEQELVPLQHMIKGLREEIDMLAAYQMKLKENSVTAKRPLKLMNGNKKCPCVRRF